MLVSNWLRLFLGSLVLNARAPAQTSVVIPPEYAQKDAPWLAEVAGFSQAFRQQVVLRGSELDSLRDKEITAIAFRRDVQLPFPLAGGRTTLVVHFSQAARHPGAVSSRFADNRGPAPVEVFAGEVEIPAAPAPDKTSPAIQVVITFTKPFVYRDGNLCIEIDGRPVPGQQPPSWPVDFANWSTGGGMGMLGRVCDARIGAMAIWKGMTPGSDAVLLANGPTQTSAVCLIGPARSSPLVLTAQPTQPCVVYVQPFSIAAFVYPRVRLEANTRIEYPVVSPTLPCFFARDIAIQWVQMPNDQTGIGIATTHAQTVQFARGLHVFPGACVQSGIAPGNQFPDHGDLFPLQIPVLRFTVR